MTEKETTTDLRKRKKRKNQKCIEEEEGDR
jgi:hypothetical protein